MTTILFTTTQTWTCPQGVFYVDVKARGGGGAGASGGSDYPYGGTGGLAGAYVASNLVPVTPGQTYTITIGQGGQPSKNYPGFDGGATTVVGITAAGGAHGLGKAYSYVSNGANGGLPAGGTAGTAGTGYEAGAGGAASGGGGGGSGDPLPNEETLGGAGGNGAATIYYNLPATDFSGTPRAGKLPVTTTWTNLTTSGSTYLWNFGNGETSTDTTPAPTTYSAPGDYTVALTSTNSYGSARLTRTGYVVVYRKPRCSSFLIVSDNLRAI